MRPSAISRSTRALFVRAQPLFGLRWREVQPRALGVDGPALAVDPAEAQRLLDGLLVPERAAARGGLPGHEPDAPRRLVVRLEPAAPLVAGQALDDRDVLHRHGRRVPGGYWCTATRPGGIGWASLRRIALATPIASHGLAVGLDADRDRQAGAGRGDVDRRRGVALAADPRHVDLGGLAGHRGRAGAGSRDGRLEVDVLDLAAVVGDVDHRRVTLRVRDAGAPGPVPLDGRHAARREQDRDGGQRLPGAGGGRRMGVASGSSWRGCVEQATSGPRVGFRRRRNHPDRGPGSR